MKIEKNKLVNRAQVLNPDIQLGVIAYSVTEMASIIEQTNAKLSSGEVTEEQHKAIVNDCTEYIKSAKEMCVESNLDWNVCILLSRTNLDKYVESKIDYSLIPVICRIFRLPLLYGILLVAISIVCITYDFYYFT